MSLSDTNPSSILRFLKSSVPSYLKPFWPEENEIGLIYKKLSSVSEPTDIKPVIKEKRKNGYDDSLVTDLDLTGEPLEVDLGSNETFNSLKSEEHEENWTMEECKHCPISLEEARQLINVHLKVKTKTDEQNEQNLPIFAVCNGADNMKTVILAAHKNTNLIMTSAVYILGLGKMNHGPLTLEAMQNEHRKYFKKANVEVKYQVQMKYQLHGISLDNIQVLNKQLSDNSSISLVVSTNKCKFEMPQDNCNMKMKLQTIVGHENSHIYRFWQELCQLQSYLDILQYDELCQNELTVLSLNPVDETIILRSIVDLISTNSLKREVKNTFDLNNLRDDTFLDKLWKIFKNCENMGILRDSFHCLFEELASAGTHIMIPEDGSYISNLIRNILNGKVIISSISFPQAIELLFELGVEKMKNDYLAIIKHFNSTKLQAINAVWASFLDKETTIQDARRTRITKNIKSCGVKLEQHINKLSYLGQLHVTSELIFLVKHAGGLSSESSFDYFCEDVVKSRLENYKKLTNFWDLRNRPLCEFECKLNWGDIKVNEGYPVQWTLVMQSESNGFEVTTTYHLSSNRWFPPVIYDDFEPVDDNKHLYYVSKMVKHVEHC